MHWNRRRGGGRGDDLITASEIACFAYCPEQWRLQYGLGLPSENQAAMDAGSRYHASKAVAERVAGWFIRLGQVLVIATLLVLLLWVLSR